MLSGSLSVTSPSPIFKGKKKTKQIGKPETRKEADELGTRRKQGVRVLVSHDGKCFKLEDMHAEVLPKYISVPCLGLILAGGGAYLPPGVGQEPAQ